VNPLLQQLTVPDLWQQNAVQHLRAGRDVVVHAPTGAGKTYIFELLYPELKGQAVFTVPTRALANDKLAEWRTRGWNVGIATGDLAYGLDSKVVVATLETQRARFLRREGPRLLVIDEYQMIGDAMRGVNYELAIALAPPTTQLLLLSGSVANPNDVVSWLRRIGRDAVLVSHSVRPVPLTEVDLEGLPNRAASNVRGLWPRLIANALHADLGPILMFAPRRKAAEEFAQNIASQLPAQDSLVLTPEQEMLAGPRLTKLLRARVAYHHSGLSYALRAGLIEPLAKNGQLRVVVATMGLAAGINFSMRSVVVTDTRYMTGHFEHQVQPDELVQMFGRAGRRGLDEVGHVLFTSRPPRLLDAHPRQLKRATQLDWPTLLSVMHAAEQRNEDPFAAAMELNRRLFTPQEIPLGIEHARSTGPMPCNLSVDMERARLIRRLVPEMQNSHGEWEHLPKSEHVPLGECLVWDEHRWIPALSRAATIDHLGYGQLCRLSTDGGPRKYGRELVLGTRRDGGLELAPWLREQLVIRHLTPLGFERVILHRLSEWIAAAAKARQVPSPTRPHSARAHFHLSAVFPRGEQLVAHLDFSPEPHPAYRDRHGAWLIAPPTREAGAPCCVGCPERDWCSTVPIHVTPAWAWRKLGLIEPDGRCTRRGVVFGFFPHGEGLAVAAALEDDTYPIEDLIFDLANLRAGARFSGDEAPHSGRLGALSQGVYERADFPGYLLMGVPTEYGAGASEVVREMVELHTPKARLLTDWLRAGDIERAMIEWRSVLRHITLAPDLDWDRWRELKAIAERYVIETESPTTGAFPPLTPSQKRRG
jgi:superfamily II DNA/RNA helicase